MLDKTTGRNPGSAAQHALSSGQLPLGATEVVFEFDDGTTFTVAPQRDGYFITAFPGVLAGARITELDADGRVVATS